MWKKKAGDTQISKSLPQGRGDTLIPFELFRKRFIRKGQADNTQSYLTIALIGEKVV